MKKIAKGDDNKWGNKEWVRQQISNIKQEDANFKAGYDAFDYLRTQRNKITHSQDNEYSVIERECVEALNKVNNLGILLEFLENCFVSIGGTAMQKSWLSQFQNIITHKPPMGIKTMYPIILQCFPKISL